MNNAEEIQRFENLEQQLHSMLNEMSELSRKKPSDGVNKFKLKFINQILEQINGLLGSYKPFPDFEQFNVDDVPTNSDIVIMLAQYASAVFRFRSDNTKEGSIGRYWWILKGKQSTIQTRVPAQFRYHPK